MKNSDIINICQVSLKRDVPLILKNYFNFKNFYEKLKIHVICPSNEFSYFKKNLHYDEFQIIDENDILSIKEFEKISLKFSKKISYLLEFNKRLNWYYQQILKLSFLIRFIDKGEQNILLWDADTIILKKIDFFKFGKSINYGTFNEFHKQYYITNKKILNTLPRYHLSFLNQFIGITKEEALFLKKKLFNEIESQNIASKISEIILSSIFSEHKEYNGSMFSEFELIGQTNYLQNNKKQKPILSLRFGLDGMLSKNQIFLVKFLNFKHITYEHSHLNKRSFGMLDRKQSWAGLIKIIMKNLFKFYLRGFKHHYLYWKNYG